MLTIHSPIGKRRRIPLTPLIDVIFILVMFFLLSSSFGIWRPLDISLGGEDVGESTESTAVSTPPVLIVLKVLPATGAQELIVNGLTIELDGLAGELNRLADAGAQTAVLVPDDATDFQQVVRILDEAKTSRIKSVSLKLQ